MITNFLIESSICLAAFLGLYLLLLESEQMQQFKRFYLLGSLIFSLAVPFISIDSGINTPVNEISLPALDLNQKYGTGSSWPVSELLAALYLSGMIIMCFRFFRNLSRIIRQIHLYSSGKHGQATLVLLPEATVPHSFLNYIFVNYKDHVSGLISEDIYQHETAHIKQLHSLDILLVEVVKVLFWFNPIVYVFSQAVRLNHEFLADEAVLNKTPDVGAYQKTLLNLISTKSPSILSSNVNYNLTKKRFLMMTTKTPLTKKIFKSVMAIPLIVALTMTFCLQANAQKTTDLPQQDPDTGDITVYTAVDQVPTFPGGTLKFYEYVSKNLNVSSATNGKLFIRFVVEKDGTLSEVTSMKNPESAISQEAVRVVKNSPKWIPGYQGGKPVRVMFTLPISIQGTSSEPSGKQ